MHTLSRLLLIVATLAGVSSMALLLWLARPYGAVLLCALVLARLARRGVGRLTTLGSARWATASELRSAGMVGADSGLVLGRLL